MSRKSYFPMSDMVDNNQSQTASYMSRPFWIALCLFIAYILKNASNVPGFNALVGLMVMAVALIPAYLWSHGIVRGLPIFPLYSLTFLWSHGVQFITDTEGLQVYDEETIWV